MKYPSSRCPECPLFLRMKDNYVPARIVPNSKMIFVGEAPGENEVLRRQPFVGKAGQYFDRQRMKAGIDRMKVSDTNVLKCRPEGNKLPEGDLLPLAVSCCSEILEKDIEGAKAIIGLGNIPLQALVGKSSVMKRRGSIYEIKKGVFFLPTIHPSAMMRASFSKKGKKDKAWFPPEEIIIADLKKSKRLMKDDFSLPKENFIIYPDQSDFDMFLERMQDPEEMVGVDIETPKDDRFELLTPIICSIAFPDLVICADFDDDLDFLTAAFESPCKKVYHNGVFDVGVKKNNCMEVENYFFDTLYGHHLMYAELQQSLGFVQSRYTDLAYHKDMRDDFADVWDK